MTKSTKKIFHSEYDRLGFSSLTDWTIIKVLRGVHRTYLLGIHRMDSVQFRDGDVSPVHSQCEYKMVALGTVLEIIDKLDFSCIVLIELLQR